MVQLSRSVKIWVFASLCSLLVWVIYMFPSNFQHLFNVIAGKQDFYAGNIGVLLSRLVGLWTRFGGVILALTGTFLVCGGDNLKPHSLIERIAEAALFLEGTYYVLLFPSGLWWLGLGLNFFGVSFLMQAVFAGVPLMLLSFKIRLADKVKALKWIGAAAVGYVAALWFNVIFRWFDMIEVIGNTFLFKGVTAWGFLGSMITLSVAMVFTVAGAYLLTENSGESIKWFGFSLVMTGIHYLIYLAYSLTSGNLDLALAVDVWTLPFLGLGTSLLKTKTGKNLL